jgi:hypothetical protein
MRHNRLDEAFKLLSTNLISSLVPSDCIKDESLLDSMPVITCSGKRKGMVAKKITDKGFCSTKALKQVTWESANFKLRSMQYKPFIPWCMTFKSKSGTVWF